MKLMTKETDAKFFLVEIADNDVSRTRVDLGMSTGWPRSYRKYILQITQPSQYGYAKLQYRFAVTYWSTGSYILLKLRTCTYEGNLF